MSDEKSPKIQADLSGVPETLLWNVYHRAIAVRARRPVIHDAQAVELVERINYPFERFKGDRTGLWHTLRVSRFDSEIRRFLAAHAEGTVVALGEGLETQFWRVDNGQVRWLTVDVPEAIELRRKLLSDGPRQRTLACSATDPRWMDEVDPSRGVLVTAQGLLMYFQPDEVRRLIQQCGERFPGQVLLFDALPAWMVAWVRAPRPWARDRYRPPWVWGVNRAERRRLAALPEVTEFDELRPVPGPGFLFGIVLPVIRRVPGLRNCIPEFPVFRVRLAAAAALAVDHDLNRT